MVFLTSEACLQPKCCFLSLRKLVSIKIYVIEVGLAFLGLGWTPAYLCDLLTHSLRHAHTKEKGLVFVFKVFLFKNKNKKRKPNQNISHWRLFLFFFCLLKILLHKYLPFPSVRRKTSLLFLKPSGELLENSPTSFLPSLTQNNANVSAGGLRLIPLMLIFNLKILAQHCRSTLNKQQKIYIYNISPQKTKPFKHSDFSCFLFIEQLFFNHQVILYYIYIIIYI